MWFSKAFPELVQEHGQMKRVDVRCGFSKQCLKGKIEDTHMSQIWFKQGNALGFSFHFGCGVFVGPAVRQDDALQFLAQIMPKNIA